MSKSSSALVVIADSDQSVRTAVCDWMTSDGYTLLEARDEAECLAACAQKPDLILLAANLPPTGGFALCKQLKASAPVLMLLDSDELIEQAFAAGADDFMTRPLYPTALRQRVRHLLLASRAANSVTTEHAEVTLSAERFLLRTLIDNLPDHIFVKDAQSQFILVNTATARYLRADTPAEVIGKTDYDFFPQAQAMLFAETERHIMQTGEGQVNTEWLITDEDNRERWVLGMKLPLRNDAGEVVGLVGIDRDITDLKLSEQALQRARDELEMRVQERTLELLAANEALQQQIAERERAENAEREQRILAESLRDTAAAINSTLNLDEVLEQILAQVAQVIPHDAADIMLIESGIARIVRGRGYAERGVEEAVLALRFPVHEIVNFRQMIESGKPLLIADTHDPIPDWVTFSETAWIRSVVAAPIHVGGQVIGFINADSTVPGAYSHIHAERLQAFADQVGVALHNAQLYDAIRRHAEDMEQRVAERTAELESERAQLRPILDGMRDGVMGAMHYEGRVPRLRYINQAMYQLLGYRVEEWNPTLLKSETMRPEQFSSLWITVERKVFEEGYWKGELKLRRKDGTEFDAELTITRVDKPDGGVLGSVLMIRDISEAKALQEQKDRFVAYASHELRTPITNLKTRLYLMRNQPLKLNEHLTIIEQVTERMQKLVEGLLDLSRFKSGVIPLKRQSLVVQDLLRDVVRVQQAEAERKRISITMDMPTTPLLVEADSERMIQVFTNLMTNAINYTPDGGTIEIRAVEDGGAALIHVQDSGIGIDTEHLPYIFQPFYRAGAKTGGTGLGLSIAREIVELHGGTITVESEVGQGSCFTVRLIGTMA
jgi:PAS domain S-box-containing protein